MTAKHSQAATPPAEPTYSHEETERLLNAFGAWACGNLADGSSAHWNIRQVAAQLARADKRVTWCEKELSEMRLLVNGYFSTADALTKTEDERDRLQRENEAMRKAINRVVELWHDFPGNPAGDIIAAYNELQNAALTRKEE